MRARAARSHFGIEVIDLRIKRADLPAANQQAVYARMQLQPAAAGGPDPRRGRAAEARDHRRRRQAGDHHPGRRPPQEAFTTRGAGDAESARIFASSFGKDPSFAAFYRSHAGL